MREMAKIQGLYPAKDGRNAYVRVCIPLDLQAAYGGRKDIRRSLGNGDWAQIKLRAVQAQAELRAEFEAKRASLRASQQLTPVKEVPPELGAAIALGVYATTLEQDDQARESLDTRKALDVLATHVEAPLQALKIPQAPKQHPQGPQQEGMTEKQASTLAGLHDLAELQASIGLARRDLSLVRPIADGVARSMGLQVDWTTDSARSALRTSLEELRKGWKDRTRRDAGEAIPTPTAPATWSPAAPGKTLWDVMEEWKRTNLPDRTYISRAASAIRIVDTTLGKLPLDAYTKAQGAEVVAALLKEHASAHKTAKLKLDTLNTLLTYAAERLDWLPSNPWKAYSVTVKKARARTDLKGDALERLFGSPLFKSYALPSDPNAGGAAAYWVPLLGLYTGARQSELCQLRVSDVDEHPELGLYLHIVRDAGGDDEGTPEARTKSETSSRRTPIHPDLIRLGFADYVQATRNAGHASLFPDVRRHESEPAGYYFSDWWSRYRKAQGVGGRYQDFHAFRHTARTRLTDAGVDNTISSALLGHIVAGSTGRTVYDHSLKTLRPNLEKLVYPELDLQRSYQE